MESIRGHQVLSNENDVQYLVKYSGSDECQWVGRDAIDDRDMMEKYNKDNNIHCTEDEDNDHVPQEEEGEGKNLEENGSSEIHSGEKNDDEGEEQGADNDEERIVIDEDGEKEESRSLKGKVREIRRFKKDLLNKRRIRAKDIEVMDDSINDGVESETRSNERDSNEDEESDSEEESDGFEEGSEETGRDERSSIEDSEEGEDESSSDYYEDSISSEGSSSSDSREDLKDRRLGLKRHYLKGQLLKECRSRHRGFSSSSRRRRSSLDRVPIRVPSKSYKRYRKGSKKYRYIDEDDYDYKVEGDLNKHTIKKICSSIFIDDTMFFEVSWNRDFKGRRPRKALIEDELFARAYPQKVIDFMRRARYLDDYN